MEKPIGFIWHSSTTENMLGQSAYRACSARASLPRGSSYERLRWTVRTSHRHTLRPPPSPWTLSGPVPRDVPRGTRWIHVEAFLVPPLVFTGLLAVLWTWKCVTMVLLQNKIIYMPGLPPGTRREEIGDYSRDCRGVVWHNERLRSEDGTLLALAVTSPPAVGLAQTSKTHIYILYFQGERLECACDLIARQTNLYICSGNAASIPPRLPTISAILHAAFNGPGPPVAYTMACVSYRGYWKSSGRPSEKGINMDVLSAWKWASDTHARLYPFSDDTRPRPVLILWGQSIGAGFATNLAAKIANHGDLAPAANQQLLPVDAVILETPFVSVRAMLKALYPQKWLPYRHLWPFLRNQLDSAANLETIAGSHVRSHPPPRFLLVIAEKDEIVPRHHAEELHQRCERLGLPTERHIVRGAYHNEASTRRDGQVAIANFIRGCAEAGHAREAREGQDARMKGG
ncbi:BEM46 family protein [Magnaporthiopsis poae ATCC 64411]|uniref:BEM46 family protein n=1 Tax=Magnaporthiopsis poae (strain ATCC 64411 / 73-15) TaxID=644358 RepID=A0A0C4E3V7_MAGP6|nr:BEM46 family protein [Magnaporthiopsis poae ATCC 64411]